jgi:hypothetical protein
LSFAGLTRYVPEGTTLVTKSFHHTAAQAHEREAAGLPTAVMSRLILVKSTHSRIGCAIGKAQNLPTLLHSGWETDSSVAPVSLAYERTQPERPWRQGERTVCLQRGLLRSGGSGGGATRRAATDVHCVTLENRRAVWSPPEGSVREGGHLGRRRLAADVFAVRTGRRGWLPHLDADLRVREDSAFGGGRRA